jgi:RimJ/RimL family protein N-acetyltransferase
MTSPLLIDFPAALDTPRLQLRPPQAGDGHAVYEALSESLPALREFLSSLPWVAAEPSGEASEAWCRQAQANFLARTDLPFLMLERGTGQVVGATGLHRPVWATPRFEVGYWCRSSRAGGGYVSEAVATLVDFAFRGLRAARVELITDEANIGSRRVAERCGFTLEGTRRNEHRAPDGSLRHMCMYARIASPA